MDRSRDRSYQATEEMFRGGVYEFWVWGGVAGWLVGWLAGWLAGWLDGWLAAWLAGWLAGAGVVRRWSQGR